MGRQQMAQQEVAEFIAELRKAGATRIQRLPATQDGRVEVRWEDSPAEREAYRAYLRAWRPLYFISIGFAVLFVVLTVLLGF